MKLNWLNRTCLRLPKMILCTKEKEFLEVAKRCNVNDPNPFINDTDAACLHTFDDEGWKVCVVCIRVDRKRKDYVTYSLLGHEAVHVKQETLLMIGENNVGNEVEAYIVENCLCQLIKAYEIAKSKKK